MKITSLVSTKRRRRQETLRLRTEALPLLQLNRASGWSPSGNAVAADGSVHADLINKPHPKDHNRSDKACPNCSCKSFTQQ